MRLQCEAVVNEALPAVRSLIAKELQDKGYSQTEIADMMNVTQPAVSQYLSAARGNDVQRIEDNTEAYQQVQELVTAITNGTDEEELSQRLHDTCLKLINEDCCHQ